MNSKYEIDMCNGSIVDKLISFSIPLMLSGILQLMFNAVDIIVIGRVNGSESLAAVGATTAVIYVFTNLFLGISQGVNVVIARYYAMKEEDVISDIVHTAVSFALISGVAMAVFGIIFSGKALEIMGTPESVIGKSTLYMKIYFLGMPFFMVYNYVSAILRAVGDTKRPLIFLTISGLVNVGLNIFLVTVVRLDVAGVAIGTVASQFVSCILVVRCLMKTNGSYQLFLTRFMIKVPYLKQIFAVGIPAGIQSMVISFSNAMLQSSVNSFGAMAMAGYTAANNVFGFMFAVVNSITQACMSFTSQNYGAGKYKRMDRIFKNCLILTICISILIGSGVYLCGSQILKLYTSEAKVIQYGIEAFRYTTTIYFLFGIMDLFPGVLRGLNYSTIPMILSIIGTVGTRIVWIGGIFPMYRSLKILFISYPVSWILTIIMQGVCYVVVRKKVYGSMEKELLPV